MTLLIDYVGLTKTDLFQFFNLSETNRAKTEENVTRISLKPGGYQEHIDIEFKITQNGDILRADLYLDRKWIGDWKTVNPFGKDIAKSFIECLYTKFERPKVRSLVSAIWTLKGVDDEVISIHSESVSKLGTEEQRAIDVYTGKEKSFQKMLDKSEIMLENIRHSGKERLHITISTF